MEFEWIRCMEFVGGRGEWKFERIEKKDKSKLK
jgi:hypothetical protein